MLFSGQDVRHALNAGPFSLPDFDRKIASTARSYEDREHSSLLQGDGTI